MSTVEASVGTRSFLSHQPAKVAHVELYMWLVKVRLDACIVSMTLGEKLLPLARWSVAATERPDEPTTPG